MDNQITKRRTKRLRNLVHGETKMGHTDLMTSVIFYKTNASEYRNKRNQLVIVGA